jgi:hypothetical protein
MEPFSPWKASDWILFSLIILIASLFFRWPDRCRRGEGLETIVPGGKHATEYVEPV